MHTFSSEGSLLMFVTETLLTQTVLLKHQNILLLFWLYIYYLTNSDLFIEDTVKNYSHLVSYLKLQIYDFRFFQQLHIF